MKVGDLVHWEGADLIASALNHPEILVTGMITEVRQRKESGTGTIAVLCPATGHTVYFSPEVLKVISESR